MIVINRNGLNDKEFEKVVRPYAKNSGAKVDFRAAGRAAADFLSENPTLLMDAGRILDEPQQ